MVRKSPSKNVKRTQGSATGRKPGSLSTSLLNPDLAPRLDPQDELDSEPWSPTRPSLRSPTKPLAQQLSSLQQEKDAIDSKLWEATVELQEKTRQTQLDNEIIAKLQSELAKTRSYNENDTQKLNSFETSEFQLRSTLLEAQKQAAVDKRIALEKLEARDNYIEKLQGQLESFRKEMVSLREAASSSNSDAIPPNDHAVLGDDSSSIKGDTTEDHSFSSAFLPQTPGNNVLLSTLGRHKRQLRAQRNLLNKQRTEISELRKQLPNTVDIPVSSWDSLPEGDVSDSTLEHDSAAGSQSLLLEQTIGDENAAGFSLGDDLMTSNLDSHDADDHSIPPLLFSQAHAFNHKLIPVEEYEHLSRLEAKSQASMGYEDLKQLASQLNYSVLSNVEFDKLKNLLHGGKPADLSHHSHVLQDLVSNNVIDSLAISKNQAAWAASNAAPKALRDYVMENDLALIPNSVSAFSEILDKAGYQIFHSSEVSPTSSRSISSSPDRSTRTMAKPVIPRIPLDSLTRDELASAAASQGLAVLPVKQIEALQNRWKLFKDTEIPTAAEVAQIAKRAGLLVLPENPTLDELNHVVKDDMIVVDRQDYEALEAPGPATLRRLAALHDLCLIPQSELDRLREIQNNQALKQKPNKAETYNGVKEPVDSSIEIMRQLAEKNDMVVLSASDYQQMLTSRSTREFSNLPMAQRTQYYEQLIDQQKRSPSSTSPRQSPVNNSLGSMEDRAKRMGRLLITPEEYQQLKQSQKIYEPTKTDVIQSAKAFGLATMSIDEFAALRSRKWKDASRGKSTFSSDSSLIDYSSPDSQGEGSDEIRVVPANYLAALQRIAESPTESDLRSMANKLKFNLTAADTDEDQVLRRARELGLSRLFNKDEIIEEALALGLIRPYSDSEIIENGKRLGLLSPLSDKDIAAKAKLLGLAEPLSKEDIISEARRLGLVTPLGNDEIIASAKRLGCLDPSDEASITERAKSLGLVRPLSDSEIEARALSLGLVHPMPQDVVVERAKSLGFIDSSDNALIIQMAKGHGLIDPPSREEILSKARDFGLTDPLNNDEIILRAQHLGLSYPLTDAEIISRAKSLGLIEPYTDSEVLAKAKALGMAKPLNEKEILSKAMSLGLRSPLNDDEVILKARSLGLTDPLNDDEILIKAKALGLAPPLSKEQIISEAETIGLRSPLTETEILNNAMALGLVEPSNENFIRMRAKDLGLVDSLSDEEIISKARELGLRDPISEAEIVSSSRLLGLIDPPKDEEILSKAKQLGLIEPLNEQQLILKAEGLGLERPLTNLEIMREARSLGLIDRPSDDETIARARTLGLAHPPSDHEVTERAQSLGLVYPPGNHELVAKAKNLGLIEPLSDKEILAKASMLGYAPLDDTDIVSRAKELGLTQPLTDQDVLSKAKVLGLVEPVSDQEIASRASNLGFIKEADALEKATQMGWAPIFKEKDMVTHAKSLGSLEPTSEKFYQEAQNAGLRNVTPSLVKRLALELGMIEGPVENIKMPNDSGSVVSDLLTGSGQKSRSARNSSQTVAASNEKNRSAENNSMGALPEMSSISTMSTVESNDDRGRRKDSPTPEEAKLNWTEAQAGEDHDKIMNHSEEPMDEVDVFQTFTRPSASAAATIFPRRLTHSVGKLNLPASIKSNAPTPSEDVDALVSLRTSEIQVDTNKRPSPPTLTSGNNVSRPAGETPIRRVTHYEVRGARSPWKSNPPLSLPRMSRASGPSTPVEVSHSAQNSLRSLTNDPNRPQSLGTTRRSTQSSMHTYTGLSQQAMSMRSIATLTQNDMEHMISQVMMGEVLYKYHGGMNFEGITGGRHKRYFWFRPESKLLFWNRENPSVLGTGVAKSITLVGVDEEVDRNPLPSGLFHRSLILKGREREVRVTCFTQNRHAVWLATLRHILSTEYSGLHH